MVIISDHVYEVFLSFRGEDTRFGFTDHLHKALLDADINTFRDNECIPTGDDLKPELENAIKQSRASIIVLSKNYASSKWCLNELLLILEQRRKSKMIVLPIFYHVDPSHVRKQEGSFAEALKNHEKCIDAETDPEKKQQMIHKMKLWKDALSKVADMKGKDIKGWYETIFIQEVVTEIGSRLERKVSTTFPGFIGMFSQVHEIETWLKDGSEKDIDMITICGMGGIGKSTLARYIYDKNFGLFENSCFLEKISSSDDKLSLQRQLLKDIKTKREICTVIEGTTVIEKTLLNKRVLLVLDDIDNVDQLDMLLGTKGFHPGSKIIITTKNRSLPKKCEVWKKDFLSKKYTEHLLEGLDIDESLELLSRHAFRCDSPKFGFEKPSRKVVKYCGGHPLALKVLGSSLFQRDVAAWEETLQLLEEETDSRIHFALKISFDSLNLENDKKLFKYIACFFVRKDSDYIGKILKECGIYTSSGILNLIDKCLLTVDSDNCVQMHQLLQDLGRHIVHRESPEDPWNRSILCCHKEALDVLKKDQGTAKTKAVLMDYKILFEDEHHKKSGTLALLGCLILLCSKFHREEEEEEGNLKTESFTNMKNLELLQLNYVQLTGSYEKFPKRLRWLCWHGFPSHYIPLDLPMTKLVVLDMSHSKLKGLGIIPKSLISLKILNLSNSLELITTGDFSGVPNLERLILTGCCNLVEISESIGELHELSLLDLSCCIMLSELPRNMSKLIKMKTLLLEGCSSLFKTLVVPHSPHSSWLLLPRFIVDLNLASNDLFSESFPEDFSHLSSLAKLNLSYNPIDSLPDCVKTLGRIELLDISFCENLKSALDLPSGIENLSLIGCESLEVITFHSAHTKLVNFCSVGCHKLKEAQFFFKLEPLEKVGKAITDRLGWSGLGFLENQDAIMLYEYSIFSTYFPDNQVPHWFSYQTNGSSMSFTVPPSPSNHNRIRGLNVCFVRKLSLDPFNIPTTIIKNRTNNLIWVYINKIEKFSVHRDIVVMSHWIFEDNELEVGDEVYIQHYTHRKECWDIIGCCNSLRWIYENKEFDDNELEVGDEEYVEHSKNVTRCGVEIVYHEHNSELQDRETDPLFYYKSWKDRIGYDPLDVDLCRWKDIPWKYEGDDEMSTTFVSNEDYLKDLGIKIMWQSRRGSLEY